MGPRVDWESALPKRARDLIQKQREEIARLKGVEEAHALLVGREWVALHGPREEDHAGRDYLRLYRLDPEGAHAVVSLSKGDVLVVGRARARWGGSPVHIVPEPPRVGP